MLKGQNFSGVFPEIREDLTNNFLSDLFFIEGEINGIMLGHLKSIFPCPKSPVNLPSPKK